MADGTYQLVIGGVNAQGQFAMNTFSFSVTGTGGDDEWTTAKKLCDAWEATNTPLMIAMMGNDTTLNILYAKKIDTTGGASIFKSIVDVGIATATAISNAVAVTAAVFPGGALNRAGRVFFWGLSSAFFVGDVLTNAGNTAINNFMNALFTALSLAGGGTATYGTWSRKTKTFTQAAHYNVKPKLAGMTKRTKPLY